MAHCSGLFCSYFCIIPTPSTVQIHNFLHMSFLLSFSITSSITHLSNSVHILPFTLYYSSLLTSYHLTPKTLCYTILLSLSYQTNTFIWNISPSNTVKSSPKLHAYTTNQFNVPICSPSSNEPCSFTPNTDHSTFPTPLHTTPIPFPSDALICGDPTLSMGLHSHPTLNYVPSISHNSFHSTFQQHTVTFPHTHQLSNLTK